jgi:hypothetical protein
MESVLEGGISTLTLLYRGIHTDKNKRAWNGARGDLAGCRLSQMSFAESEQPVSAVQHPGTRSMDSQLLRATIPTSMRLWTMRLATLIVKPKTTQNVSRSSCE